MSKRSNVVAFSDEEVNGVSETLSIKESSPQIASRSRPDMDEVHETLGKRQRRLDVESQLDYDSSCVANRPLFDNNSAKSQKHTQQPKSSFLVLHRVFCGQEVKPGEDHSGHLDVAVYHDHPRLFAKDTRASSLRGLQHIANVENFFHDHEELDFVVYRNHNCGDYHDKMKDCFSHTAPETIDRRTFEKLRPWFYVLSKDADLIPEQSEEIYIIETGLLEALEDFVSRDDGIYQCFHPEKSLKAPYDFFFHFQIHLWELLTGEVETMAPFAESIEDLLHYINTTYENQWKVAYHLFDQGLVTEEVFSKLFRVGEILITKEDGVAKSYMITNVQIHSNPRSQKKETLVSCWALTFDGNFRKQHRTITVDWPDEKSKLTDLVAWPLRLDRSGLQAHLEERGREFWLCRRKRLVNYHSPQSTNFDLPMGTPKFMIDIDTHRALHPDKYNEHQLKDYEIVDMTSDAPPSGHFALLMPAFIPGFGFHDKKWRTLQVDHIRSVNWNVNAFNRLVLKANKKELIQALVTIHLESNPATDVIEGKGAGLIILLHGPPGTGKTLTAETVAELANKPLYRVTCGDIGTDAEGVEKYLESALYLGTLWDCVVLLDEADVFLEERTQTDLARNALVSVFLRVLEYFNGILILTSNRVGLFDEAFKSRMQLVIRYPHLDEPGRFKIWDNFFKALQKTGADMEFEDLSDNVRSLAQKKLNGRQIRNVIKTARQLAAFRGQRFGNQHLESAIEVVEEFEKYLVDTRGSDSHFLRQERIRLE